MSEEVDDLFEDGVSEEGAQQQEQQQPDGSPAQQQQQQDADDGGGLQDLEDDMGDEQPDEADLFGSDDDEGAAAEAPADEPTGEPITVCAPLLQRPPANKLVLLKVPNIIKVDPMPYDPEQTEIEPELVLQGGKRQLRPNDINVIRWRFRQNEDGSVTRESNARYVKWEDGSESILLGDEVLTMDRQKQPRANTYVHVVRYDAIQGLAHIKQTAHLKPASLDNKLHQRLKMTVQQSSQKTDKVQVHLAARNPEQEKLEAEKAAEDAAKLRRTQARVTERNRVPKQRVPVFTAAYIEEDEDEGYYSDGQPDEEDDYYRRPRDDDEAAARLRNAKRSTPPPASIRSGKQQRVAPAADEEDDKEEDGAAAAATAKAAGLKVVRGAILDDEDDD